MEEVMITAQDLEPYRKDPVVNQMLTYGGELTRERYIILATLNMPETYQWDGEDEKDMPPPFRLADTAF
jgi:hypothetical protein